MLKQILKAKNVTVIDGCGNFIASIKPEDAKTLVLRGQAKIKDQYMIEVE